MSDKLNKQIATEREQLKQLLETHHAILNKCKTNPPTVDEVPALASILHSFYSGIERIFKRISVERDGGVAQGQFWHTELLESMSRPGPKRPAVISETLHDTLQAYLDFRHVFRHAYSFELDWKKMEPLVLDVKNTLNHLNEQLDRFVNKT